MKPWIILLLALIGYLAITGKLPFLAEILEPPHITVDVPYDFRLGSNEIPIPENLDKTKIYKVDVFIGCCVVDGSEDIDVYVNGKKAGRMSCSENYYVDSSKCRDIYGQSKYHHYNFQKFTIYFNEPVMSLNINIKDVQGEPEVLRFSRGYTPTAHYNDNLALDHKVDWAPHCDQYYKIRYYRSGVRFYQRVECIKDSDCALGRKCINYICVGEPATTTTTIPPTPTTVPSPQPKTIFDLIIEKIESIINWILGLFR